MANAIWLCQACGKLVDSDLARFSESELRAWKASAEVAALKELGRQAPGGSGFARLERALTGHENYVWDVIATPDGRRVISASNDRTAALWDLRTGQRLCVYEGARSEVCSLALSPGGRYIAGGCLNGDVLLWQTESPQCVGAFDHGGPDAKVAWMGDLIVTAGSDGHLRRWRSDGVAVQELKAHDAPVLKVTCMDDGRTATASEDGTVRVWSSEWSELLCEFYGHSGHVNSVAIAVGSELAITGADDCTVNVWDLSSAELRRTLVGHCETVWRVAVDNQERWIASGSGDSTVRLWDLSTGAVLDELRHDDCVAAVTFSPDATRLVVGCDDAKLYVYCVG